MRTNKEKMLLFAIFLVALVIRFFYFPGDIYFAYDQARDAYISLKAVAGDLKIVGPPATFQGVNHGALFYYIFGPIYYLASGDPSGVTIFLRIYNALGVYVIYLVTKYLFKSGVTGFIAAFIYALSFEQSQYSLFIGHPSLGVVSVLVFYLGMAMTLFGKKSSGLIVAALGLGLSIQFHFSMINLVLVSAILFVFFQKDFPRFSMQDYILAIASFIFAIVTYILAELKFGFGATRALLSFFTGEAEGSFFYPKNLPQVLARFINDNLMQFGDGEVLAVGLLIVYTIVFYLKPQVRKPLTFLAIWLMGGILPYALGEAAITVYYYSIGGSVALIIFSSYLINTVLDKNFLLGISFLIIIAISNLSLIRMHNPYGTIPEINVQDKMLLRDEKAILDFLYSDSEGEKFSANALTIPYNIYTTWSYLFEWYGGSKYGYLPVWGGHAASGFEGNLEINTAQSELPDLKYIIIEPERGMPSGLKESFLQEEDRFWQKTGEMKFGELKVEKRIKL
jgi:hypothetical protein